MGDLSQTGVTSYPTTLDTYTVVTPTAGYVATHPNGLANALVAVETEVGTFCRGAYSNVVTRLNAVDTSLVNLTAASATIPTSKGSGQIVQSITVNFVGATTTAAPLVQISNNPVTSTMGTTFGNALSLNFKAMNALNSVYVMGNIIWPLESIGFFVAGLFTGASSSAIATWGETIDASNIGMTSMPILWKVTTVSTATINYTLRFVNFYDFNYGGPSSIGLNNYTSGAAFANNSLTSNLTVFEVQN